MILKSKRRHHHSSRIFENEKGQDEVDYNEWYEYKESDVKEAVLNLKKFIQKNKTDIKDELHYDDEWISVSSLIEFIDLVEFGDFEK